MSEPFDPYRKWLGIPPAEQPPHHYRLLGINAFEDDPDVIDNAAHRQMAHIRTFQGSKHAAFSQRLLTELAAAKVCLLDPARKSAYDQALRESLEPSFPPVRVGGQKRWLPPGAPEPVTAPSVVPIPGVASVGTTAFPAVRRPTPSYSRKKQSTLPLVLMGLCVVAAIGLGAAAYVYFNGAAQDEPRSSKGKPSPAVSRQHEPPPPAPGKRQQRNADLQAVTPFPVGGETIDSGTRVPAPRPPEPQKPQGMAEVVDQLNQALYLAEEALAHRDDEKFRAHFTRAEQLLAQHAAPETAPHREKTEDLRTLQRLVDQFWNTVRDNVHNQFTVGEKYEPFKFRFELTRREGELVEYHLDGVAQQSAIADLEPRAALLIAMKTMNQNDAATLLPAAAFLSIDSQAEGREHKAARHYYDLARQLGKHEPAIARQLNLAGPEDPIMLDPELMAPGVAPPQP